MNIASTTRSQAYSCIGDIFDGLFGGPPWSHEEKISFSGIKLGSVCERIGACIQKCTEH